MASHADFDPAAKSGYGLPNTITLVAQTLSAAQTGKDSWYTNANWGRAGVTVAHLEDVQINQDVLSSNTTAETVKLQKVDAAGNVLETLYTYNAISSGVSSGTLGTQPVTVSLRKKTLKRGEGLSLDVATGSGGTQGSGVTMKVNMTCFGIER